MLVLLGLYHLAGEEEDIMQEVAMGEVVELVVGVEEDMEMEEILAKMEDMLQEVVVIQILQDEVAMEFV